MKKIMTRPYVVALEGIPGSGKTTLRSIIEVDDLSIDRVEQILPGDPEDDYDLGLDKIIQSDLLKTKRTASGEHRIVVLDRYYLSTLAYQFSYDSMNKTNTYGNLKKLYDDYLENGELVTPDVTFYIDTPVEESYARKNRVPGGSIWEDKIFLGLNQVYYRNQEGFYIIDGSKGLGEIQHIIEDVIRKGVVAQWVIE